MLKKIGALAVSVAGLVFVTHHAAARAILEGESLFLERCAICHAAATPLAGAPTQAALRQLPPEAVYRALTAGLMVQNSAGLNDDQKRKIAEFVTEKKIGATASADASALPNRCGPEPFVAPSETPNWNGWGANLDNARFQTEKAAGLTAAQAPKLKLKWAFALPNATAVQAQPTVVGDRLYVGSNAGVVYALNAKSGCVYWSFEAKGNIHNAFTVGKLPAGAPARYAVFFGDQKANVYALDAETGKEIWSKQVDPHVSALINGSPAYYDGRLYVPVSSMEEANAAVSSYPCCTFRGSLNAFEAATGTLIWKSYTIPEAPSPTQKTADGVQLYAPAGGAIWSAPTLDPKRGAIYVGTGDAYSEPAAPTTDAIVAFDMKTGAIRWVRQTTKNDAYIANCGGPNMPPLAPDRTQFCPKNLGPDFDYGSSPILQTLPDGRDVIIASQKSSITYAMDPDHEGNVLWMARVGKGGVAGGTEWGAAADGRTAYVPTADHVPDPKSAGGVTALDMATGKQLWIIRPEVKPCVGAGAPPAAPNNAPPNPAGGAQPALPAPATCVSPAQVSAISVIPGVVFAGTLDGVLHAYSTKDGKTLWQFETARAFPDTIDKVPGHGGNMNGPGPTIAGGMVYVGSGGLSRFGGTGSGNMLFAFGLD